MEPCGKMWGMDTFQASRLMIWVGLGISREGIRVPAALTRCKGADGRVPCHRLPQLSLADNALDEEGW